MKRAEAVSFCLFLTASQLQFAFSLCFHLLKFDILILLLQSDNNYNISLFLGVLLLGCAEQFSQNASYTVQTSDTMYFALTSMCSLLGQNSFRGETSHKDMITSETIIAQIFNTHNSNSHINSMADFLFVGEY